MIYQIYARVSERGSDWEGETSCAAQIAACREHLARVDPGAKFATDRIDEFISGRTNDRPALQALLAEAASGHARWDAMAVLNIDRLTRSMEGYIEILRVLSKAGKGLIAVRQNLDLASPSGRFMLQLLVSAAEYFAHLGGENTKAKMLSQARAGQYLTGRPPMGYRIDKAAKDNILQPDPAKAPIVRDVFRRYAEGQTITDIRRAYKSLPINTIRKMLHAPVYIGKISFSGQVFDGKHEPIIDDAVWKTVQDRLPKSRTTPRANACEYDYILTGLVRCACGRAMSPCTQTKPSGLVIPYYRCTDSVNCSHREYIRADHLEAAATESILEAWKDAALIDMATRNRSQEAEKLVKKLTDEITDLNSAMQPLERDRERIKRMFIDGVVTRENAPQFNQDLSKVTGTIETLTGRRDALQHDLESQRAQVAALKTKTLTDRMAEVARDFGKLNSYQEKRAFLRAVVIDIARNEKGTWAIKRHVPSSTNEPDWHPLGESNPSFQDENLMS